MAFQSISPPVRVHSPLHTLDPRVKLITALALILGILLTPDRAYPAYPLMWALIASLAVIGRIGGLRLARRSAIALPFALAALTLVFTIPGAPLITVGGLTITDAGLIRFTGVLLKAWLTVQVSVLVAMTTAFTDLLWAAQQLGVPSLLVQIITLLYRYLFTVGDEAARLRAARAARSGSVSGRREGGTLLWRAQVAGSMVGSLFLRSVERSERVYAAMAARGFTGRAAAAVRPPLHWHAVVMGMLPTGIMVLIQIAARFWWTHG